MIKPLLINSMWGMGDNIYQRPFIKLLASVTPVYLTTPWPELYQDIKNVFFVKTHRQLRTQLKNIARQPFGTWVSPNQIPNPHNSLRVGYRLTTGSIPSDFCETFGMVDFKPELDFPAAFHEPPTVKYDKPLAIVRPASRRTEWSNTARNPLPEYIDYVSRRFAETHYILCVADLTRPDEVLIGNLPFAHSYATKGEIPFPELMRLVCASDILIGGVGWIVPAAIAAKRRAFILLGGHGGHNHPSKITMPYWKHRVGFAFPDQYCMCSNKHHACYKVNSNLEAQLNEYLIKYPNARTVDVVSSLGNRLLSG